MELKILVFYGSVRSSRKGIRAATFIIQQLEKRGHEAVLIDPLEYDFPMLDRMYKEFEKGKAPEKMEKLAKLILEADGFVVVSGEYNHSIPPALSNLMDHYLEEYSFRPSGIVSYSAGRFGGVRAAMQLRAFLTEIGTVCIPTIFPIASVHKSIGEDGATSADSLHKSAGKFLDELEWYAKVIKEGKEKYDTPY